MKERILVALDTSDYEQAERTVKALGGQVGGFKIGHALTLAHGLGVMDRLAQAGAERIFLDLKFHDIPHSVGLAVAEAARRGAWMITVHSTGGRAMLTAAAEAAQKVERPPLVVAVTVLTSLDEATLRQELGVSRTLEEQVLALAELARQSGVSGVVASPHEARAIRRQSGPDFVIVTPGIRPAGGETHDQQRAATPHAAVANGSTYLVVGRALTDSPDPIAALERLVDNG